MKASNCQLTDSQEIEGLELKALEAPAQADPKLA
jgi:hypothetical protein